MIGSLVSQQLFQHQIRLVNPAKQYGQGCIIRQPHPFYHAEHRIKSKIRNTQIKFPTLHSMSRPGMHQKVNEQQKCHHISPIKCPWYFDQAHRRHHRPQQQGKVVRGVDPAIKTIRNLKLTQEKQTYTRNR